MSFNIPEQSEEMNIYNKIIDCYLKNRKNYFKLEMCKNRSIIRLMDIMRRKNDKQLAMNSLIVVLSLFGENPADLFSNIGKDIKTVTDNNEKEKIVSELKKEFRV